jgi:hypothetical protein
MPSLHRLSALVLGLLFLQLTLLGDSASCRSRAVAGAEATMAAMDMAGAGHDGAPASHDGCGGERATSRCASMPSCATVIAAPVTVVALVQSAVPAAQALPAPVSVHSQPTLGPDVPPPRG